MSTTTLERATTDFPDGHRGVDAQTQTAVGGHTSTQGHATPEAQAHSALGGDHLPAEAATMSPESNAPARPLLDPLLILASVTLDDLENQRIAQENRYRSLTNSGTSENGLEWGYGLDDRDPQVAAMGAIVDQMKQMEHTANLQLQKLMRKHPLGPWVKAQKGIGDKQAARLLGVISDPYWHSAEERPRTVSELWAYCGLKPFQRRQKGQQANWSDDAKKRVWLIATSCLKAGGPYRDVYDRRRELTAEREHTVECVRCGPSGKPAQPGTPWSAGHQHADALRITSKRILQDMWRESKRLHEQSNA